MKCKLKTKSLNAKEAALSKEQIPSKLNNQFDDTRLAFTMKEVAELLGLSERTVWALVNCGQIASFKAGRSVRIPRQAVNTFMGVNP